jgi:hypothetical protein
MDWASNNEEISLSPSYYHLIVEKMLALQLEE